MSYEPEFCVCCGKPGREMPSVASGGKMHFACWDEHHSDPTGVWPPDHVCKVPR